MQHIKIWVLVIIFALPGCLAYYAYTHPNILSGTTNNKGRLLKPVVQLSSLTSDKSPATAKIIGVQQNNQWYLLLWQPSTCDISCIKTINRLSRLRLALGRKFYLLNIGLLMPTFVTIPSALQMQWQKQNIYIYTLDTHDTQQLYNNIKKYSILIANPRKYAILTYPNTDKLTNIFDDLQRLI